MSADLEIIEHAPTNLFGAPDPEAVIEHATRAAQPLAEVVKRQKMYVTISGREHVRVEGWTLLGSMLGVFPVCVWTKQMYDTDGVPIGWEARVEARTRDGAVVGAAEAECLTDEKTWANRDDYALRSMAQTRATSKALRQPLGFVMQLAGFDPTPAEEMPRDEPQRDKLPPSVGVTGATDAQLKLINTLLTKLGLGRADEHARLGVGSFTELTKQRASEYITELKAVEATADVPF